MTRTLNSPIADQRGEFAYLYEMHSLNVSTPEVLRITNASADVTALSETWTAVGGALVQGGAPETGDRKAQGMGLELYGLDQTIIQQIQNNQFRGQILRIYLIHWDPDTGVQDTPDEVWTGRQNADYKVTESRDPDSTESGGIVRVSTRITADLASVNSKVSVRSNVASHEEFLRRSGVGAPDDKFFERVASLSSKAVYWGTTNPELPPPPDITYDEGADYEGGEG